VWRSRNRCSPGDWVALATACLVCAVFVAINLAPYLGLPQVGAMVMYSGLDAVESNHLFMPRLQLSDAGTYLRISGVEPRGTSTQVTRDFEAFAGWAGRRGRLVNLSFLRYQADRMCASVASAQVGLTLRTTDGTILRFRDVCAEPSMRRWVPLPLYEACRPECPGVLHRWAAGEPPA
jgi:hypothetical protein